MRVIAIVLGAGQGARLGSGAPKAGVRIAGRSLLHWSAAALGGARGVDALLAVIAPGAEAAAAEVRRLWRGPAAWLEPTSGGPTRQASLDRGLQALALQAPEAEWVLVHDAARCLVLPEDAEAVLHGARESGAAVPVLPLEDTVKEVDGDRVVRTADRDRLARALTPQAFRLSVLREALEKAEREGFTGTDCASLVERMGVRVRTCPGRRENFKVTHVSDLERAEAVLRARGAQP